MTGLPGAELVESGLRDLTAGRITESALLILIAGPRLRRIGIGVPVSAGVVRPYEHRLYEMLEETLEEEAYSRFNSLLRRVASFCSAAEHRFRWRSGDSGR